MIDTQAIRNKILDLAIRGKLVPQDPNDEPASVLLERIRAERERLIAEGKIKGGQKTPSRIFRGADNTHYEIVGNNPPVSIEEEIPFEIPENWAWVRLPTIASLYLGKMLDAQKNKGTLAPYLRNINVKWGEFDLTDLLKMKFEDVENDRFLIKKGDLVVCEGGEPGRCAIWDKEYPIHFQKALHRIRFYGDIKASFFMFLIKYYAFTGFLKALFTGSTINHLTGQSLEKILVPIPPLEEQKRVVAKIDQLSSILKAIDTLQARYVDNLASLKKSILQEAVMGKLVPQDPNDEPASVLLERIRAEKERLIAEGKIKRDKNESRIYKRGNSYYENQAGKERCIDDELPFEIPENWAWCNLKALGKNVDAAFADGPFGSNLKKEHYTNNREVRIIQLSNIGEQGWRNENVKYTTYEHALKLSRSMLKPGVIVIAKMMPAGRAVIVPQIDNDYILSSDAVKFIPHESLNIDYLLLAINSSVFYNQVISETNGVTRIRTSLGKLQKYLLPIPPLEEQKRIVDKIEILHQTNDKLYHEIL